MMLGRPFFKILLFQFVCIGSLCNAQNQWKPLVLVHYMPWFQTPSFHGSWGWHWTMNHYNPDVFDSSGHRSIASHFYPLSGPYDSDDPNILEYQTLLMKISGIDGVLVDWYGSDNALDYGTLNASTQNIFIAIKKASLLFGIVYEDQSIKHMIDGGYFTSGQAYDHGKGAMTYLENSWMGTENYVHLDGRPVLLVFGPQYFLQSAQWDTLFSVLRSSPLLFTLDTRLSPVAAGAFPWPPMWKSNAAGIVTPDALSNYLASFYQQSSGSSFLVATAFPGFHDIYKEAGVGASYGFLDPLNGATLSSTLHQALNHHADLIQIATWNDYGEGTIIEPTAQFGYQYLDTLQSVKRASDSTFRFEEKDFQWPMEIFALRLRYAGNTSINSTLNGVFSLIVSAERDSIDAILDSLDQLNLVTGPGLRSPGAYVLNQNYPNPFNPSTTIEYILPRASNVNIEILSLLGEHVATLYRGVQSAGRQQIRWRSALSSGIYFYRIDATALNNASVHFIETKKMLLLK
jgi:Secretion system C-terminal sorting domain